MKSKLPFLPRGKIFTQAVIANYGQLSNLDQFLSDVLSQHNINVAYQTTGDKLLTAMIICNGIATSESRLIRTIDFCMKKFRQSV